MHRLLLCTAFVALAALALAPEPASACGSCGGGHGSHGFIGFLDYRHSLDAIDRHHSRELDRRREYVFHRMSGPEAYEVWHGGGHHEHQADHGRGRWQTHAHAVTAVHHRGGGTHNHAWGIHASDHGDQY